MPTPSIPLPDERVLTVAECAEASRLSKMTIYRLVHNGEIPATRIGRSLRVYTEGFLRYLEGQNIVPEDVA